MKHLRVCCNALLVLMFSGCGAVDNSELPSMCKDKPSLCGFYLGQRFDPTNDKNKAEYAIFNLKEDYIARTKRPMWEFGFKPKDRVPGCTIYEMRVDKKTRRVMCVLAKYENRDESFDERCVKAEKNVRLLEGKFAGKYSGYKRERRKDNELEVGEYTFSDGKTYHYTIKALPEKYSCVLECEDTYLDDVEAEITGGKPSSYYVHVSKEKRCEAEWNELWEKVKEKSSICPRTFLGFEFGRSYSEKERYQKKYIDGFKEVWLYGDPLKKIRLHRTESADSKHWAYNQADATFQKMQNLFGIKIHQYYQPDMAVYMYRNNRMDIYMSFKEEDDGKWGVDLEITDNAQ